MAFVTAVVRASSFAAIIVELPSGKGHSLLGRELLEVLVVMGDRLVAFTSVEELTSPFIELSLNLIEQETAKRVHLSYQKDYNSSWPPFLPSLRQSSANVPSSYFLPFI